MINFSSVFITKLLTEKWKNTSATSECHFSHNCRITMARMLILLHEPSALRNLTIYRIGPFPGLAGNAPNDLSAFLPFPGRAASVAPRRSRCARHAASTLHAASGTNGVL